MYLVQKNRINVRKIVADSAKWPCPQAAGTTVLCKLVVSLQMQNRKTTDKISTFPNFPNYSIVVIADQRALRLHFATDNQLAKPSCTRSGCKPSII